MINVLVLKTHIYTYIGGGGGGGGGHTQVDTGATHAEHLHKLAARIVGGTKVFAYPPPPPPSRYNHCAACGNRICCRLLSVT